MEKGKKRWNNGVRGPRAVGAVEMEKDVDYEPVQTARGVPSIPLRGRADGVLRCITRRLAVRTCSSPRALHYPLRLRSSHKARAAEGECPAFRIHPILNAAAHSLARIPFVPVTLCSACLPAPATLPFLPPFHPLALPPLHLLRPLRLQPARPCLHASTSAHAPPLRFPVPISPTPALLPHLARRFASTPRFPLRPSTCAPAVRASPVPRTSLRPQRARSTLRSSTHAPKSPRACAPNLPILPTLALVHRAIAPPSALPASSQHMRPCRSRFTHTPHLASSPARALHTSLQHPCSQIAPCPCSQFAHSPTLALVHRAIAPPLRVLCCCCSAARPAHVCRAAAWPPSTMPCPLLHCACWQHPACLPGPARLPRCLAPCSLAPPHLPARYCLVYPGKLGQFWRMEGHIGGGEVFAPTRLRMGQRMSATGAGSSTGVELAPSTYPPCATYTLITAPHSHHAIVPPPLFRSNSRVPPALAIYPSYYVRPLCLHLIFLSTLAIPFLIDQSHIDLSQLVAAYIHSVLVAFFACVSVDYGYVSAQQGDGEAIE
ncbi:hypothetical protein B0H14DRAFT_1668391 [Mycena olivaceomarginata]|nr:hypothetical protein B0H14DRAFT_1668391 [Mycena olivaceomarginata]